MVVIRQLNKKDRAQSCEVRATRLVRHILIAKYLSSYGFEQCTDRCVIDRPGKYIRFLCVYRLYTHKWNYKHYIYTQINIKYCLESISGIFKYGHVLEREIRERNGVKFNLINGTLRILTDYGFKRHPLIKDFPRIGKTEIAYYDTKKLIKESKVEISQQYRIFTHDEVWGEEVTVDHDDEENEYLYEYDNWVEGENNFFLSERLEIEGWDEEKEEETKNFKYDEDGWADLVD
jgi:NADH-quinone oxidoreductase subunit C